MQAKCDKYKYVSARLFSSDRQKRLYVEDTVAPHWLLYTQKKSSSADLQRISISVYSCTVCLWLKQTMSHELKLLCLLDLYPAASSHWRNQCSHLRQTSYARNGKRTIFVVIISFLLQ